jgi:hypothetical protein
VLTIAGQRSPLAPNAKNGPKAATRKTWAMDEFRITAGGVGCDETK